ncbi:MAG: 5'/3'-nucleotidase SurE, partial [Acidobacteria bacterium]|nr:5'/3'-nucleotidase SurE [Acidobacteriota bacterium]
QGTDVWATSQGYVAVTPLRVGEFDRKTYEGLKDLR